MAALKLLQQSPSVSNAISASTLSGRLLEQTPLLGRRCAALFLGLVITANIGCSASGPGFKPVVLQDDQAAVYVYRPGQSYAGSFVVLPIKVDDKKIGGLVNNGYVCTAIPPGRHEVSSSTEAKSSVPFEAEPKRSYYIEAETQMGLFVGRPNLRMVPEETGKLAILGTRYCKN